MRTATATLANSVAVAAALAVAYSGWFENEMVVDDRRHGQNQPIVQQCEFNRLNTQNIYTNTNVYSQYLYTHTHTQLCGMTIVFVLYAFVHFYICTFVVSTIGRRRRRHRLFFWYGMAVSVCRSLFSFWSCSSAHIASMGSLCVCTRSYTYRKRVLYGDGFAGIFFIFFSKHKCNINYVCVCVAVCRYIHISRHTTQYTSCAFMAEHYFFDCIFVHYNSVFFLFVFSFLGRCIKT